MHFNFERMRNVALLLTIFAYCFVETNGVVTCKLGYEKVTDNMNEFCRLCPHPTYSNTETETCATCPAPNISHDGISCNFCENGFGYDDELGDCVVCPAHHESVDGRCVACVNGFTSTGTHSCVSCPNNLTADLRLLKCRCQYGQELNNMGECLQCPEATPYSDGLKCTDCVGHANIDSPELSYDEHDHSEHEHNEEDAFFCSPCRFGEYFEIESGACEACADGQLSDGFVCKNYGFVMPNLFDANEPNFQPICATCLSGQKMEQSGLGFKCVKCPKGYYKAVDAPLSEISSCTPCPPHEYQDDEGMTSCKPCMSNITTVAREAPNPGSAVCTPCRPGTYFDPTTQLCTACEEGTFQENWGSHSCEPCALGNHTEGKTGQIRCQPCPGGTYGFTTENGLNSCRRCEKVAVIEGDGQVKYTFAIGNVEGATSEEEANCQSPDTVWKTCETIAAEECSEGEYLVGCNTNSRGTCQNCSTVASTAGCVGRIQFCGGISAGCCGTENFECVETRGSSVMTIEPLHSFRFTADNESLYLSWFDGKVRTYRIMINFHTIDGTVSTTIESVEGLSTSIRYGSPEFPCGSENPCLMFQGANEWVVNITITPEGGSPVELENVLSSVDNRTFNLTDLAWVNIENLIEYDKSVHITSVDPNFGYWMSINYDDTEFLNPVIELDLGQTLAFFIGNVPGMYLFDFYDEDGTMITDGSIVRVSIQQQIQAIKPTEEGMFSYVSRDGSPKLKGLIRVGSNAMLFTWELSEQTAYIISGIDRYNPEFVNEITPTLYARSYDKIFVDFSDDVENLHPVEVLSHDGQTIEISRPETSWPFFYVQGPGRYYYRCKIHPTNTFLQGNIIVFHEVHEVNISINADNQMYPYVLSGSDRIENFAAVPQRDIQIELGDLLVMNTIHSENAPQVVITNEDGVEVSYVDLYNPASIRFMPLYEPSTTVQLFRYTCSGVKEPELCPIDEYGNTRYRGLIYVGISKDICTQGSVPSSTGCQACLEGFRDATGDAEYQAFKGQCLPCEVGSYQDQRAQTQCIPCAEGFYQNISAQHECIACPIESFQKYIRADLLPPMSSFRR